jgi:hypothetical protein
MIVELVELDHFSYDPCVGYHIASFKLKSEEDAIKLARHLIRSQRTFTWHGIEEELGTVFNWASFEWEDGTPILVNLSGEKGPCLEVAMTFTPEGDDKLDGTKWPINNPSLDDILHYAAVVREALKDSVQ